MEFEQMDLHSITYMYTQKESEQICIALQCWINNNYYYMSIFTQDIISICNRMVYCGIWD